MSSPEPIFRPEALARSAVASTPGTRIRLVRPGDAAALAALAVVVGLACLWLVFGRVSVRVDGAGILLRPRSVGVGETPDALLATLDEPALTQRQDQLEQRLAAVRRRTAGSEASRAREVAIEQESLARRAADLDERLASLEGLLRAQESTSRSVSAARRAQLLAAEGEAAALVESRHAEVVATEDLVRRGASAPAALVDARALERAAQQDLDDVRLALAALPLDDIGAAQVRDGLAERIDGVRADRAAVEQRQLALAREEEERRALAAEDDAALVDQLEAVALALERQRVDLAGEPAAPAAEVPPAEGLVALVFMDAADAKRVVEGMEIHVSLDPVERARYGSLLGTVTEVSERPIAPAQADALLSNASLADTLARGGRAVLVVARLTPDPTTPSGYAWTTSGGPPTPPSPGTTLSASVTVERRRPITWVLPALRTLLGVED